MSGSCEMPPDIKQIDTEINYIANNMIPGENLMPMDFTSPYGSS